MAVTIDEFKRHGASRKSRFDFPLTSEREWIDRAKALAVVLLILVLGLVSGLAFGFDGIGDAASAWPLRADSAFV
jgi:hypothetical protein